MGVILPLALPETWTPWIPPLTPLECPLRAVFAPLSPFDYGGLDLPGAPALTKTLADLCLPRLS